MVEVNELYPQLGRVDPIDALYPLFKAGQLRIDPESKKIVTSTLGADFDGHWIYQSKNDRNCNLWQALATHAGFIPTPCLECYKVLVVPQTVEQLIEILEIQQSSSLHCKCGKETRPYVDRIYGAYFFAWGLEEGKKLLAKVKELLPDYNPILKRYCTEFERQYGPSDKYIQPHFAKDIEAVLEECADLPIPDTNQPDYLRGHCVRVWIRWAADHGDLTYKKFNGNRSLHPDYVSYE